MSLIDAAGWDALCPDTNETRQNEARPTFVPGGMVWVVERDEDGNAIAVTGLIFVAEVAGAVIATPKVYGREGLEEVMKYHIEETASNDCTELSVYPAKDCYLRRSDAKKEFAAETEEE